MVEEFYYDSPINHESGDKAMPRKTFAQVIAFGQTAAVFARLRAENPGYRAVEVYDYMKEQTFMTLEQFCCRHDFAIDYTTDRCYCMNCGLDGDA